MHDGQNQHDYSQTAASKTYILDNETIAEGLYAQLGQQCGL